MSKVINKKLHPYYKTGIYGWFGEEVDDNDYIICPICGEVLGMNYWDYSAEHDGDNKCPNCKQELDYSDIYYFEDTCYFEQLLQIKDYQLEIKDKALDLALEDINSLYREKKLKGRTKLVLTMEPFGLMNLKEHFIKEAREMMKSE